MVAQKANHIKCHFDSDNLVVPSIKSEQPYEFENGDD
jgi:hypothetical protein